VDKVIQLEGELQVSQALLHAHPQDNEGMLVGQVDELRDGFSVVIDLLLEKPLPGTVSSHAGSHHLKAIGPDVLKSEHLSLGRVALDGWLPLTKKDKRLFKRQVIRAEDVDVVEVGQDEPVWAEGGS
jgi:hypothetical protein